MRSFLLVAAGVCVCFTSREALADERQPSTDLRGLYAPMHHEAGLVVEPADSPDTGSVTANMRLVYAFRPVVLRDDAGEIAYHVVEHQFTTDVGLSVGLFGRVTLGLDLPVLVGQVGDDMTDATEANRFVGSSPVPIASLGDPAVRAKVTILKPRIESDVARGFGLAVDERFTLPLGDERSFIAEGGVSSETRVLAEYGFGAISAHLAAGVKLRQGFGAYACDPEASEDDCLSRFGHELPLVAAVALHPHDLGIDPESRGTLFLEAHGHLPLAPVTPDESTAPWAMYLGLTGRYRAGDLAFLASAEIGLIDGVGSAPMRAMLGMSFAPRSADTDHDGLADDDDRCPTYPEDKDGFEDDDGCPEMDNDKDGVPDSVDACPTRAGDGPDGCPKA